jgi:hypothetical protein
MHTSTTVQPGHRGAKNFSHSMAIASFASATDQTSGEGNVSKP